MVGADTEILERVIASFGGSMVSDWLKTIVKLCPRQYGTPVPQKNIKDLRIFL